MRFFTFLALLLVCIQGQAQQIYAEFLSNETPTTGSSTVTLKLKALDSVYVYPGWEWDVPAGIQVQESFTSPQLLMGGDSLQTTVTFTYSTGYAPYYAQVVEAVGREAVGREAVETAVA